MRSQRARVRHFVRRVRDRGQVVRVRVQYPGEVQRHVYGHGVVERGFCFQRERLRARVGCATFHRNGNSGSHIGTGLVVQ